MAKKFVREILPVSQVALKLRSQYFPVKIAPGVTCEAVPVEEVNAFIRKNFTKVFGSQFTPRFVIKENTKEWFGSRQVMKEYQQIHVEAFLFKQNGKIIGWSYGEIDDFETFYMRNTGFLKEFRNKGYYSAFLKIFLKYLKELGYQRVSSQHAPDNLPIYKTKMAEGFLVVGSENHEKWGQLVKMVKILNPKREKVYKERFG